jgi:hypothetical protein
LFTAVHKCWKPPPLAQAHTGVQITVQFSITRDGRLQGKAVVRYESPDASDDERLAYRRSVAESLAPCVAFPITDGLGNAVAGRPLNVRFIDTHKQREADRSNRHEIDPGRCRAFGSAIIWLSCSHRIELCGVLNRHPEGATGENVMANVHGRFVWYEATH